jgi:hypothetical protein
VAAAATLAALLVAVAAVNVAVDPYGLFGTRAVEGFNAKKVRAEQEGRLFKSASVARVSPQVVILGNSRAEIGFDPRSAAWPDGAGPVYNFALPGTGPRSAADTLSVAAGARIPTTVVLGVDFPDFLRTPDERSLAPVIPSVGAPGPSIEAYARSALTVDSLLNSLLTVLRQNEPESTELTAFGFNPLRDYAALVRREGHRSLFDQKNAEYQARLAGGRFMPDAAKSTEFGQLDAILAFARQHGIRVHLVIYPYHAEFLDIVESSGLWPAFEKWKRQLVANAAGARGDVHLWDFSGYSRYTTEAVPRKRGEQMQWYWESGHFKPALGDVVIEDLYRTHPRLGRRMTRDTVEAALAAVRAERDAHRAASVATVAAHAR